MWCSPSLKFLVSLVSQLYDSMIHKAHLFKWSLDWNNSLDLHIWRTRWPIYQDKGSQLDFLRGSFNPSWKIFVFEPPSSCDEFCFWSLKHWKFSKFLNVASFECCIATLSRKDFSPLPSWSCRRLPKTPWNCLDKSTLPWFHMMFFTQNQYITSPPSCSWMVRGGTTFSSNLHQLFSEHTKQKKVDIHSFSKIVDTPISPQP